MNKDSHIMFESYIKHLSRSENAEGQLCLQDLAAKHGVDLHDLERQLEIGISVEHEHTDDVDVAKKIALDHLSEDPAYYIKLAQVETGKDGEAQQYADDMQGDYASQKLGAEDAEQYGMPANKFKSLKLPKSPITFKKPSKEKPYTHKYMHDLVKRDSREAHLDKE